MSDIIRTGPSVRRGSSKQDYATPADFRQAVVGRFGHPTFDLAADATNYFATGLYFHSGQDSLKQDWRKLKGLMWLNPPFDRIAPWARKCNESSVWRQDFEILLLVPASVGSDWYRDHTHNKSRVIFLNGRISFDGIAPYPKDCMLAHYGSKLGPGFEIWNWRLEVKGIKINERVS